MGIEPPQGPYLLDLQDLPNARIGRNCTDLLVSVQFRTNFCRLNRLRSRASKTFKVSMIRNLYLLFRRPDNTNNVAVALHYLIYAVAVAMLFLSLF